MALGIVMSEESVKVGVVFTISRGTNPSAEVSLISSRYMPVRYSSGLGEPRRAIDLRPMLQDV